MTKSDINRLRINSQFCEKEIKEMKKSIKVIIAGILMVPMLAIGAVSIAPTTVSAATTTPCVPAKVGYSLANADTTMCVINACVDQPNVTALGLCSANGGKVITPIFGNGGIFQTVTNIALFIIGALSVIMLIFGGIKYTVSAGDAKQVEAAKNTIMYAIIGVVVALLAGAIVNFVLTSLIK